MKNKAKSIKIFLIILAILIALFFVLKPYVLKTLMGVSIKNQEAINRLIEGKEKVDTMPEFLQINGEEIPFDKTENRVFISQNMDEKKWEGIIAATQGRIYFINDELITNKSEAISSNKEFDLYWISDDSYFKTKVVFTGMPIMTLTAWCEAGENRWGGAVQLYDPSQKGLEYQAGTCNFGDRGNIARRYEKKSYKLTLSDEKMSLCGLRKDDDWTLNGLYDDVGLVRNKMAYDLWNEISATNNVDGDNTVESAFVELIVNGDYRGVYLLCDRIDQKKIGLGEGEHLYKQRRWVFNVDDIDEAYSVKYDGGDLEEDVKASMLDIMDVAYNYSEIDSSYEEFSDKFYMENTVDYYLYCQMLCAGDNLFRNSYFAEKKDEKGNLKFMEIPWDVNATFGIAHRMTYFPDRIEALDTDSYVGAALSYYDNEAFSSLTKKRWAELRKSAFSKENMNEMANEYIAYTVKAGAFERNLERWSQYIVIDSDRGPREFTDLWNEDDLYTYIDKRVDFLDKYYMVED